MPLSHTLLVIAVVFIWGTNFVAIRWALDEVPPFTVAVLRFFLAALPWVLFVRRPRVAWRWMIASGLAVGPGQFGLLYIAMRADISPGLASLLMQCQVFMTMGLATALFGERLARASLLGLALATAGLVVVALHTGADATAIGVAIVLLSAACWALGNLVIQLAARSAPEGFDMLAFMLWSSLFACPPLLVLALLLEGASVMVDALSSATALGWASMIWQSLGNALIGFGVWNWLLMRHPAASVTPFALLVPVFGMTASALVLNEAMPTWKLVAGVLVVVGLAIHVGHPLLRRRAA